MVLLGLSPGIMSPLDMFVYDILCAHCGGCWIVISSLFRLKCWYLPTELHGIVSQKTANFRNCCYETTGLPRLLKHGCELSIF